MHRLFLAGGGESSALRILAEASNGYADQGRQVAEYLEMARGRWLRDGDRRTLRRALIGLLAMLEE